MSDDSGIRLDKWLWAARFFKTRSLAAAAIDSGKIDVNGERAKRSKELRIGDLVRVRIGAFVHVVTVLRVVPQRGSASIAQTMYDETAESLAERTAQRERLALLPAAFIPAAARPTKKDRRALSRFRGK